MVPQKYGWRNNRKFHKRKSNTKKIIDRINYDPGKHKQKKTRELREKLQRQNIPASPSPADTPTKIKFGSINVNGLDVETTWAVHKLIKERDFDVRLLSY